MFSKQLIKSNKIKLTALALSLVLILVALATLVTPSIQRRELAQPKIGNNKKQDSIITKTLPQDVIVNLKSTYKEPPNHYLFENETGLFIGDLNTDASNQILDYTNGDNYNPFSLSYRFHLSPNKKYIAYYKIKQAKVNEYLERLRTVPEKLGCEFCDGEKELNVVAELHLLDISNPQNISDIAIDPNFVCRNDSWPACDLFWDSESDRIYYRKLVGNKVKGEAYYYDISKKTISTSLFPNKTFGEMRINNLDKAFNGNLFVDILDGGEGDFDDQASAYIIEVTNIKNNEIIYRIPTAMNSYEYELVTPQLLMLHKSIFSNNDLSSITLLDLTTGQYYDLMTLNNQNFSQNLKTVKFSPDRRSVATIFSKTEENNKSQSVLILSVESTEFKEYKPDDAFENTNIFWLSNDEVLFLTGSSKASTDGKFENNEYIINLSANIIEKTQKFVDRNILSVF